MLHNAYSMPNSFLCPHEKYVSGIVWTALNRRKSHSSNTVQQWLAERVWRTKPQSLILNTVEPPLTANSPQRPLPPTNGHLPTTATSPQWPHPHNGHLSTMATFPQRPPLHNGHILTTATSPQWSHPHNGHFFCPSGQSLHWLFFKPLYNDHFSAIATAINVFPLNNLSTTAIFFKKSQEWLWNLIRMRVDD